MENIMNKILCISNKGFKQGLIPAEIIDLYNYDFSFLNKDSSLNNYKIKELIPYVILKSYDTYIVYAFKNSKGFKINSIGFWDNIVIHDAGMELSSEDIRYSFDSILSKSINRILKEKLDLDIDGIKKESLFWVNSDTTLEDKKKIAECMDKLGLTKDDFINKHKEKLNGHG